MKKILFVVLLLGPSLAMAVGGWSASGTIEKIYTNGAFTYVTLSDSSANPDACQLSHQYVLALGYPNHDAILSGILTAFASGKTVRTWLSGCSGGSSGYPQMTSIEITR